MIENRSVIWGKSYQTGFQFNNDSGTIIGARRCHRQIFRTPLADTSSRHLLSTFLLPVSFSPTLSTHQPWLTPTMHR